MNNLYNFKKVLITGAAGFIGSRLIRRMMEEEFHVGIIEQKGANFQHIKEPINDISVYHIDLKRTHDVKVVLKEFQPEAIIHLATYYAIDHKDDEIKRMIDTNVLGTINLLNYAKDISVKLFVNTSTCFVYKAFKQKIAENAELMPLNLYALTKIQAENSCTFYAKKYGIQVVTLRLFPPYGPHDHKRRLIPFVIKHILDGNKTLPISTGKQKWDMVFVDDVVNAYLKVLSVGKLAKKHEIFNIGTGNAVSIHDIVIKIIDLMQSDLKPEWGTVPHRTNEVWYTNANISKANTLLNWQPQVQIIDRGLELTVQWFQDYWSKKDNEKTTN